MKIGDSAGEPGAPHGEGYLTRGASQLVTNYALAGRPYGDSRRFLSRQHILANHKPRALRFTLELQPVFDLFIRPQPGAAGMAAQRDKGAGFGMAFDLDLHPRVARV